MVARSLPLLLCLATTAAWPLYWSPPVNVSNSHQNERFSVNSSAAADGNGHFHVSYIDFNDGVGYRKLFYATNQTGGWVQYDISPPNQRKFSATCLLITPQGIVHVLYKAEETSGGQSYVFERTKPVGGGAWSNPAAISDAAHPASWLGYAAIDAGGNIYCAWLDLNWNVNRCFGRYKPLGQPWGAFDLLGTGSGDKFPQFIYCHAAGNRFVVSWIDSTTRVPHVRVRNDAGAWGPDRVPVPRAYGGERAVVAPGGEIAYLYGNDQQPTWFDVFAVFSQDAGATWSAPMIIAQNPGLEGEPEGVYDADNNLYVVWKDSRGPQPNLFLRERVNGVWSQALNLTNTPSRSGLDQNALRFFPEGISLSYTDNPINGFEDVYLMLGLFKPPQMPFITPTHTLTRTPTITLTPTVTLTPTRTNTPRPQTPSATPTPPARPHFLIW